MIRKRVILTTVLVAFVLLLMVASPMPMNKQTQSVTRDSVIDTVMVLADDTWDMRYEEHGTTTNHYYGNFTYSARLGETNIWNGTGYTPYIWNEVAREIRYFENHTIEFYDWYVRVTNDTHTLVDDARWQVYYWAEQQEKWNFLDLYSHSWLEPVFNEENMTFGQHYEDGTGNWLNMKYTISNWDIMKITAELHVTTTRQYRLVWQLTGLQGEPEFRKNEDSNFTEGIGFGKVAVGWSDVAINNGLNATFVWQDESGKLDVYFSNFTVNADETYILDPSISDDEIGADSDDTGFYDGTNNDVSNTYNDVANYYDSDRVHGMRWSLAIPEDSTFSAGYIEVYQGVNEGPTTNYIDRSTVDNPASLEGMGGEDDFPHTTTGRASIDINDNNAWRTSASIVTMMNTHIAQASWESGDYMGFVLYEAFDDTDGDTVADVQSGTGAEITLTWTEPNSVPSVNGIPTVVTLDDSDNMYPYYRQYVWTSYYEDLDGYADIDYVRFGFCTDDHGTFAFVGRFDQDTHIFIEEASYVDNWILDTGGSTYYENGNDLEVTWKFYLEWDSPSIVDYDIFCQVNDDFPSADSLYYETTKDIQTLLEYDTVASSAEYRGDLNEPFSMTGDVSYAGSALTPPSANVDVMVAVTTGGYGTNVGPWEDDTLDGSGNFDVSCYADNEVGDEIYTTKVVEEGTGYGGTDLISGTDPTDDFIADRVQVQSYTIGDSRITIDSNAQVDILLWYDYDNTAITSGTFAVNGESLSHQGSGTWRATPSKSTVQLVTYNTVTGTEGTFGISGIDQNSQSDTVIWDRVQVQSYSANDERQSTNVDVNIEALLWYDYDNTQVTDGTVTIDGYSASHIGSGVWRITRTSASVTAITYDTVTATGNSYGIDAVHQNGQSQQVVWDEAQVQGYTVSDARDNVNDNVNIDVTVYYSYDSTPITDGVLGIEGYAASHIGSGVWRITRTSATVVQITYNQITSVSGNEHGIIVEDQNGQSINVIWDEIEVYYSAVSDGRTSVDEQEWPLFRLRLKYDNHLLNDGTNDAVNIESATATWSSGDASWYKYYTQSTVDTWNFKVTSASEDTYGITALDSASATTYDADIVWDRVQVQSYSASDERDNINDNVDIDATLWYDYDDTQVTDGTVTINGYSASHQGSGVWRITRTSATVTSVTYNTVVTSGNTHGITVVDQNSQSQEVIWDRVDLTMNANYEWEIINYNVTLGATGEYEYDSTTWSGTISWVEQYPVEATTGDYVYDDASITSITDSNYGLTVFVVGQSVTVTFDDIDVGGVAYYWVQYSVNQVWLIWNPTTFQWNQNSSAIADSPQATVQTKKNGTNDSWAIVSSGTVAEVVLGPFDSNWYFVTVSASMEVMLNGYAHDWEVWSQTISVDIMHSIKIEDSGMDIQDNWITFYFHTNWNNATFYVWDGEDLIGGSLEGWYQVAKPTSVGLHNFTILVNGTQDVITLGEQNKDHSKSDSWEWLNFKFTVNPVTLSITDLLVQQNNDSIILSGWIHTPSLSMTWEAFEDGISIDTGEFVIVASGDYYAIYWGKLEIELLTNFTLTITADGSEISVHGYSFVIDGATYLSTHSSSAFFDGDEVQHIYEADNANTAFWFTMQTIILILAVPAIMGIAYFAALARKGRRRNRRQDHMIDNIRTPTSSDIDSIRRR